MKKIFILIVGLFFAIPAIAQNDVREFKQRVTQINAEKTANTKDVLTPLFRAAIDNLLGDKREFTFNSSFYGIDSILRGTSGERVEHTKFLRKNALNLGLTGDSANNVAKLSVGLTLSLMDRKDIMYKEFPSIAKNQLELKAKFNSLFRKALMNYYAENQTKADAVEQSLNQAFDSHDFSKVSEDVKTAINDPKLSKMILESVRTTVDINKAVIESTLQQMLEGKDPAEELFRNIVSNYAQNALWVLKPTYSYDRMAKQGEYAVETRFTSGIFKNFNKKPWELEIFSKLLVGNDSTLIVPNYKNKPWLVSVGLNTVVLQNAERKSTMEFKFFSSYQYKLGKNLLDRSEFTLNSTLRFNVYRSLWLPITIKYEPDGGNVFGFFSITANIGN